MKVRLGLNHESAWPQIKVGGSRAIKDLEE